MNHFLNEVEEVSSSTNRYRYDVFLSFRGADTRYGFTDHLHNALKNAGLTIFYDDEEITNGIGECNQSFQGFCYRVVQKLRLLKMELVLILKQHRDFKQIVIPIFYHVDPAHVRNQQGIFGDAMVMHNQKMEIETDAEKRSQWARNIELWKKALTEVVDLKGHNADRRLETKFIEEIVTNIYHRIDLPNLPLLIGMKDSIKFITSWLKDRSSQYGDILTILGIGGIGKTSLAKYVYTLHSREFKDSSYIPDISRRWGNLDQLLDVQKQLCREILKTSLIHVYDVSKYTSMIENALAQKKVLIVLDDIDSLDQLDALLGNKGFHPGSKIIITTKDSSMTKWCPLMSPQVQPTHTTHLLEGLSETASWELLYLNAFKGEDSKEGYEEVSENIVKYCGGHPLALKVLGKSLYNKDVAYWKEYIKELKREPKLDINKVLKMSFDTLPSRNDRELFLHIACFFVGMDKDISETILRACDNINTKTGIPNLMDRCLLRIGENNLLTMHSVIQEMGRDIVRQESPAHPEKRTRLWCHEDSFKVLKKKKGTDNIKGLVLDMRMLDEEKLRGSIKLKTDALYKMDNLMILHLNYVQINGSYENFPEELRWLCMHGFHLNSIPSDLQMENLVVLDMSYSKIESFGMSDSNPETHVKRQKHMLGSLKILDLSFCRQLRSLGGFSELPSLERLIVRNCTSLTDVCESVEQCADLILDDFSYCNECRKFAKTISELNNVKSLLLDGCNLGEFSFMIRDMDSLNMLKANSIDIKSQTSTSAIVEVIPRDLKSLAISLPSSLVELSLAYNNLSNESFPID